MRTSDGDTHVKLTVMVLLAIGDDADSGAGERRSRAGKSEQHPVQPHLHQLGGLS